MHRRQVIAAGLGLAASGRATLHAASQGTPAATPGGDSRLVTHALGESQIPANPRAVVALGDEFMLADLLVLGIRPVASSSTYGDRFIGLDGLDTEGIETFPLFDSDLEAIIRLEPDLIVAPAYVFDIIEGLYDSLSQIVPVVALADTDDWRAGFQEIAAVFGRDAAASDLITRLETDVADAAVRLALDGRTASVATIYPGDGSLTLWLTPDVVHTELLVGLGLTLRPESGDYEVDDNGRAALSLERVRELDGETLIMLQTTNDADEQETFETVLPDPLWATVPAVAADRVFVLERVGYPGAVHGRRTLLQRYEEIFAA